MLQIFFVISNSLISNSSITQLRLNLSLHLQTTTNFSPETRPKARINRRGFNVKNRDKLSKSNKKANRTKINNQIPRIDLEWAPTQNRTTTTTTTHNSSSGNLDRTITHNNNLDRTFQIELQTIPTWSSVSSNPLEVMSSSEKMSLSAPPIQDQTLSSTRRRVSYVSITVRYTAIHLRP